MQHLVYVERVHVHRQGGRLYLYPVLFVIVSGVEGAYEGGHIAPGFAGQVGIYVPEAGLTAAAGYRLAHVAGSAVVGRYGEVPVAENLVRVPQVAGCGIRRFADVHSLVHEGIDRKPVFLGGRVHELPHSLGPGPRGRLWIEVGFDECHHRQLFGQAVAVEALSYCRHIELAEAEQPAHIPAVFFRIQYNIVAYDVVVGKLYEAVHILYAPYVHRIRDIGVEEYRVHVFEFHVLVLAAAHHIPPAQQAIRRFHAVGGIGERFAAGFLFTAQGLLEPGLAFLQIEFVALYKTCKGVEFFLQHFVFTFQLGLALGQGYVCG